MLLRGLLPALAPGAHIVLLAHAWQRRHGNLRVNVYDPGLMPGTGLARDMTPARRWIWSHVMPALRVLPGVTTPQASARHLAAFALGATHPDLRGGYVDLGRVTRSSPRRTTGRARTGCGPGSRTSPATR